MQRPAGSMPQGYQRPMAPQGYRQQQPVGPDQYQQPAPEQSQRKPKRAKKGGGWRVVLQFVIGLLVIAAVASAIVVLYIRYYQ